MKINKMKIIVWIIIGAGLFYLYTYIQDISEKVNSLVESKTTYEIELEKINSQGWLDYFKQ